MDKLQLAILTEWAEDAGLHGIKGRKRMQKVIYFLQQAGCPIDADYTLHHYGPYSRDVANVTDVMVAEGLLKEHGYSGIGGGQYDYKLEGHTRDMIHRIRESPSIQAFEAYRDRAIELLRESLWHLELGSTILYFYRSRRTAQDWDSALREACEYKRTDPQDPSSQTALALAKRFAPTAA